jgi:hypothetical protein
MCRRPSATATRWYARFRDNIRPRLRRGLGIALPRGLALSRVVAMNKVVARFADGRVVKGTTSDFVPGKETFHVDQAGAPQGTRPVAVGVKDLKAVFFVKDLRGKPQHVERNTFDVSRPPAGRRVRVVFQDGEVLAGTTQGYQPGRPGFFMVPADTDSNIDRCYVVLAATREIGFP